MPGVQHLIDFVLNEVALCGNQGVYSLFTRPTFSSPQRRMSYHMWILNIPETMSRAPQSEKYVEFLLYSPSQNFLMMDLSLRSCVDPTSIYILYLKL